MSNQTSVRLTETGLSIEGGPFVSLPNAQSSDEWDLTPLLGNRWLLYPKKNQQFFGDPDQAALVADSETLSATLMGLVERQFSGTVGVDTGRGMKKLFFLRGELVFASSNLIDDRLGEVIYRVGLISLEQMTDFAVQVNRSTRFGKVLLNNKIFSSLDLWNALKLQVSEIVRSIFFSEAVFFQINRQGSTAPTSVVFDQGTRELLIASAGFGTVLRDFRRRVTENSKITVNDNQPGWREPRPDTYEADLVSLVRTYPRLGDLIKQSKLADVNTLVGIYHLVSRDVCGIDSIPEVKVNAAKGSDELRTQVTRYENLLKLAREGFAAEKQAWPQDLQNFNLRAGGDFQPALFLTEQGDISRECLQGLYVKCREGEWQRRRVLSSLESLIQFLLQVTSDYLTSDKARDIRKNFING